MRKIADTNILVRYLTGDDEKKIKQRQQKLSSMVSRLFPKQFQKFCMY